MKSVTMTMISMTRTNLVSYEEMNKSNNDQGDLNSLIENLQSDGLIQRLNRIYFFPKLTEEELALVENKDSKFLNTFTSLDPDVARNKMELSEHNSKYVRCTCYYKTVKIDPIPYYFDYRNRRVPWFIPLQWGCIG